MKRLLLALAALTMVSHPARADTQVFLWPGTKTIPLNSGGVMALPSTPIVMPGLIYSPAYYSPEVRIYTYPPDMVPARSFGGYSAPIVTGGVPYGGISSSRYIVDLTQ